MDVEEVQSLPLSVPLYSSFAVTWSEDDCVSVLTPKGTYVLGGPCSRRKSGAKRNSSMERLAYVKMSGVTRNVKRHQLFLSALVIICLNIVCCDANDITNLVFGRIVDRMPAAFGDFNSDKLTDMFVIQKDSKAVEVFLGSSQEPLLRPSNISCEFKSLHLTSVVPGDFDGDGNMDVLITSLNPSSPEFTLVHILWGGMNHINCTKEKEPIMKMKGQPLVLDFNQDMIADLFGMDVNGNRSFWIFNTNRTMPKAIKMENGREQLSSLRFPHSHAFLDLNGDFSSDLFVTTVDNFEIWLGNEDGKLEFNTTITFPRGVTGKQVGQSLFLDVELKGKMDHVLPVCIGSYCKNSSILVYSGNQWHKLPVDFQDKDKNVWGFVVQQGQKYIDTITIRGGDFNLDGYPDLLATLISEDMNPKMPKTFLLENVPCDGCPFSRTFSVRWNAFPPYNHSVLGTFFDFYQNGVLDVIIVHQPSDRGNKDHLEMAAFKNDLDYDANFVKVTVLAGECLAGNKEFSCVERGGSWGEHGPKSRYGANLPGPSVSYHTTTQEGEVQESTAAQLSQSAHFALQLPYCIFGLGRTPNFVDALTVGVSWPQVEGRKRTWTQIIPNSQVVVVPWPRGQPSKWRARLFVTPSRLVLLTAAALVGTCALIAALIAALHWKERREDRKEKLQEAHRFHFDAM
ncbi:T-cell immunomodulatory protein isoform X2 [Ischnura elegans]|uniref:T-cell immunomodulatory protein isoform X2 n=1 Tax=Ischnura elegans TaxID=197161 RepID=UPI001ED870E1|nr:T-cell immunomodulatory protein isoform X2 [Ischnura elegans]